MLIRVETQGSHGYRPTDKRIAELADQWAFAAAHAGVTTAAVPTTRLAAGRVDRRHAAVLELERRRLAALEVAGEHPGIDQRHQAAEAGSDLPGPGSCGVWPITMRRAPWRLSSASTAGC